MGRYQRPGYSGLLEAKDVPPPASKFSTYITREMSLDERSEKLLNIYINRPQPYKNNYQWIMTKGTMRLLTDMDGAVYLHGLPVKTDEFFPAGVVQLTLANTMLQDQRNQRAGYTTKDSGQRESFGTGSVRDTREDKGRFDLISPIGVKRLAQLYERGAAKYGDRNWEKGQPLSRYLDSALRHLYQLLANENDEDHAAAVAWNVFSFMHTEEKIRLGELPKELDDLGRTNDVPNS